MVSADIGVCQKKTAENQWAASINASSLVITTTKYMDTQEKDDKNYYAH